VPGDVNFACGLEVHDLKEEDTVNFEEEGDTLGFEGGRGGWRWEGWLDGVGGALDCGGFERFGGGY